MWLKSVEKFSRNCLKVENHGPIVISQTHWLVSRVRLSSSAGATPFILYTVVPSVEVVLNHSWCVTPHSSPTRGCWPLQTILNILNIFTINIYVYLTGNMHNIKILLFCWKLPSIPPPPQGLIMWPLVVLPLSFQHGICPKVHHTRGSGCSKLFMSEYWSKTRNRISETRLAQDPPPGVKGCYPTF